MEEKESKEEKRLKWTDIWLVPGMTLASWLLSFLIIYDVSSLPLFSGGTVADVEISDLYNAVGNRRNASRKASHTTIVSIDKCSREEIAQTLELISFMEPLSLGLDVFFLREDEPGLAIQEALNGFSDVVLPLDLHHPEAVSFFQNRIQHGRTGFANVISTNITGTVREFVCQKEEIPSFSYALAGEPPLQEILSTRIRFDGTEVPVLSAKKLSLADREDIKGRIVLVGAMDDPSDKYRTPIGFNTPGVLIHALVAEMMASGRYLLPASRWFEVFLAFALTAIVMLVSLLAKRHRKNDAWMLAVRILQLVLIFGVFLLGCRWYIFRGVCFNMALTVTMLATGAFVFDVVCGVYNLFGKTI